MAQLGIATRSLDSYSSSADNYTITTICHSHVQIEVESQLTVKSDNFYHFCKVTYCLVITDIHVFISIFQNFRLSHLNDLLSKQLQYIWVVPDLEKVKVELSKIRKSKRYIRETVTKLKHTEKFEEQVVKQVLLCTCKENDLKTKQYMTMLRSCLSAEKV